jgi:acyl-CoA synthetase (AMP-forming)/AMP-acid ligase II
VHLSTLLDMAADRGGDRVAVGSRGGGLSYRQIRDRARRAAAWASARGIERLGLVGVSSDAVPTLLYGAAYAGLPFVPLSYRLADARLRDVLARTAPSAVVVDDGVAERVGPVDGVELVSPGDFRRLIAEADPARAPAVDASPDDIAVLLFTSGTTGDPKAAVLRHRHLVAYVLSATEFMGAGDEAALVSVPPYHVAGVATVLTSVFAGRRVVYLPDFTPEAWMSAVRDERITHAMVVPTVLARILDLLARDGGTLPHLRHLAYGGGRMAVPVIERALALLPQVDFVNAYGLTETSSTITLLGPDDHRQAAASRDPEVRGRLGSVGRPLPTVDVEIRGADGRPVPTGEVGEIWVRGEQVAGEYLGTAGGADLVRTAEGGWLPTRDGGRLDAAGYLYLNGRLDDVIVRGAENLSPGEIEDVLVAHPDVVDAGVVGVPDPEWGQTVVAAVVLLDGVEVSEEALRDWVRSQLRSARTPDHIVFLADLPYNDMGKLLRRALRSELAAVAP